MAGADVKCYKGILVVSNILFFVRTEPHMPLRTRTLPHALTRTRTRTCSFSCSARARGSALRPRAHHRRRALSDASRRLFHQQEPRHWCGTRPRACAHTQGLTQGASGRLCSRLDHSRRAHLFHFVHRPPRRAQDQPRPAEIRTELAPKRPPARPVLYPVSLSGLALLARCRIVLCPRPHHRHHSARPGHRRLRLPGRGTPPLAPPARVERTGACSRWAAPPKWTAPSQIPTLASDAWTLATPEAKLDVQNAVRLPPLPSAFVNRLTSCCPVAHTAVSSTAAGGQTPPTVPSPRRAASTYVPPSPCALLCASTLLALPACTDPSLFMPCTARVPPRMAATTAATPPSWTRSRAILPRSRCLPLSLASSRCARPPAALRASHRPASLTYPPSTLAAASFRDQLMILILTCCLIQKVPTKQQQEQALLDEARAANRGSTSTPGQGQYGSYA